MDVAADCIERVMDDSWRSFDLSKRVFVWADRFLTHPSFGLLAATNRACHREILNAKRSLKCLAALFLNLKIRMTQHDFMCINSRDRKTILNCEYVKVAFNWNRETTVPWLVCSHSRNSGRTVLFGSNIPTYPSLLLPHHAANHQC